MLNKKDQKIIRQMMRHIRTFPLLDSEIRQFERDLTGMALEAEKRGEDFEDVLDMTPTEFCDELLYSIGGSKAPGLNLHKPDYLYYLLQQLVLLSFCYLYHLGIPLNAIVAQPKNLHSS